MKMEKKIFHFSFLILSVIFSSSYSGMFFFFDLSFRMFFQIKIKTNMILKNWMCYDIYYTFPFFLLSFSLLPLSLPFSLLFDKLMIIIGVLKVDILPEYSIFDFFSAIEFIEIWRLVIHFLISTRENEISEYHHKKIHCNIIDEFSKFLKILNLSC